MKQAHTTTKRWILQAVALLCLAGMSPVALAQTVIVNYVLDDVWLLPDISHPFSQTPQQMIGTFQWTYEEGDFENGSGEFIELIIPWYGSDYEALNINIDATSTEFTLPGNFHDLGLDLTLRLTAPLSPDQPSPIDTLFSLFEIQQGAIRQGHVISGRILPLGDNCPGDLNGDGVVNATDLATMLGAWGVNPTLPADLDGDGFVGAADLATMLGAWGPCP